MSLTTGRGPLSPRRAGTFTPPIPEGVVYVEPFPRHVRGLLADRAVIDSRAVLLVHRAGLPPTFAFPVGDVDLAGAEAEPAAPGHVRVNWGSIEHWYEEEQEVFGHPRNPYHRVDCVPTARSVRVEVRGVELVDAARTTGVYETALAPRFYVDRSDVRMDLLVPSATTTYCPYKGTASYWSAVVDGVTVDDVAWSYDDPLPECLTIGERLCFDEHRAGVTVEQTDPV